MPHLLLVLSGLADDPQDELDGRTPLQAAVTPHLDELAHRSEVGLLHLLPETTPDEPAIGSDQTTLALLGYSPAAGGRAAVELLGAGAALGRRDAGVRLDLLTWGAELERFPLPPLPEDWDALGESLARALSRPGLAVKAVAPKRWLGLWEDGPVEARCTPPGELDPSQPLEAQWPRGEGEDELRWLVDISREVLARHPVNQRRAGDGLPTFDVAWPWGCGRAPELPVFVLRTGQVVSVLTRNLAVRGAARAAGVSVLRRTDELTAEAMLAALDHAPTLLVHVNDADRAGHFGDVAYKRDVIAWLDREILGPLVAKTGRDDELAITIVSDYASLLATRRHASRPVPYLAWRPGARIAGPREFDEFSVAAGRLRQGAVDLRGWLWSR
ncbi:MAG: hypothetical protein IT204_17300 [Fimbriimonadaceae bacterium]|nr:hypothetical protein [Fimbriimonadaceae bacterium]